MDTLKVGSENWSEEELNFSRVLTVVKKRRDYSCSHVESGSSSGAHGISSSPMYIED